MSNTAFEAMERIMKTMEPVTKMHEAFSRYSAMENLAMKAFPISSAALDAIEMANRISRFQLPTLPDTIARALETANSVKGLVASPLPDNLARVLESARFQQDRFTSLFESMDKMMSPAIALSQSHSLQNALAIKADQILSKLAFAGQWPDIEAFEEASETAMDWGDRFVGNDQVTQEDFEEFKAAVIKQISRIGKDAVSQAMVWVAILGLLYSMVQEYRYQTQPQAVTMEQYNAFKSEILETVKAAIREQKEYRIVDRTCKVYLKPKTKSYVVAQVDSGQEMILLQPLRKWAQVSFVDSQDGLIQTGWVLKKYLK